MSSGRLIVFSLLAIGVSCGPSRPSPAKSVGPVSMIQLIAHPDQFDGQRVGVIGFLRLEFEGNALYLHEEDYKRGLTKNALWIDVPEQVRASPKECDMKYTLIYGTFSAKHQGHMGLFSGAIEKVEWLRTVHQDRIQQPHPPMVPDDATSATTTNPSPLSGPE